MTDNTTTFAEIAEYEAKRANLKRFYTARLKAMSASDPEYGRPWDERADALRNLASAYGMPAGLREQP